MNSKIRFQSLFMSNDEVSFDSGWEVEKDFDDELCNILGIDNVPEGEDGDCFIVLGLGTFQGEEVMVFEGMILPQLDWRENIYVCSLNSSLKRKVQDWLMT